jgi:glyoxylase-like metal-dependent hydrolase (beta-lactamase superfamily II)
MSEDKFTVKDINDGIFAITSSEWSGKGALNRFLPIMQSYVITGKEKCLVIDSPVPEIHGFHDFLMQRFNLPLVAVNTHGHIDHTGCNGQFGKVYLSEKDFSLIKGGGIVRGQGEVGYNMTPLSEGDNIELGNRTVIVVPLPGHTEGSIGFFDIRTKILFSGDAIARRVLYGLSDKVPLDVYLSSLKKVSKLQPKYIYSMHDSFALHGKMNERIVEIIESKLNSADKEWISPVDGRPFIRILENEESDEDFFDFTIDKNIIVKE